MSGVENRKVQENEDGMRLDRWYKIHFPEVSFGYLQKLLRKGQIRVDGSRVKSNTRLEAGQTVRIPPVKASSNNETREPGQKRISKADIEYVQNLVIHKDNDIIAINKPSGLAVQGGTKTERHLDGLLDALKFEADERPRLVHRLDKDTSGLLLLARNRKSATALGKVLSGHKAQKIYWALVRGVPRYEAGEINQPLIKKGSAGDERIRIAERDDPAAMKALTHYKLIDTAGQKMAWLAMMPVTGRTHQLRVHAVALGHPIIGDGKYGGAEAHPGGDIPKKLHLHAHSLKLPHPSGGILELTATLPDHMHHSWNLLNFSENETVIEFE